MAGGGNLILVAFLALAKMGARRWTSSSGAEERPLLSLSLSAMVARYVVWCSGGECGTKLGGLRSESGSNVTE